MKLKIIFPILLAFLSISCTETIEIPYQETKLEGIGTVKWAKLSQRVNKKGEVECKNFLSTYTVKNETFDCYGCTKQALVSQLFTHPMTLIEVKNKKDLEYFNYEISLESKEHIKELRKYVLDKIDSKVYPEKRSKKTYFLTHKSPQVSDSKTQCASSGSSDVITIKHCSPKEISKLLSSYTRTLFFHATDSVSKHSMELPWTQDFSTLKTALEKEGWNIEETQKEWEYLVVEQR